MTTIDELVDAIHRKFSSLGYRPPVGQHTVLAAFVLWNDITQTFKIISLATGLKCLPTARLPLAGDALHDNHAEILARRGAIHWFLGEIGRFTGSAHGDSTWIAKFSHPTTAHGGFSIKEGVRIIMYISAVPCGDASTRYLAAFQDERIAALKDSEARPIIPLGAIARGRENYHLYSVLRTKPGRADSLPASCMSCSDKIASWCLLGFQGALASFFFSPLYISSIIIGGIQDAMQDVIREDCLRAFWKRIVGRFQEFPLGFRLHKPNIHFTAVMFPYAREYLASQEARPITSCNESLCWIADSMQSHDVLINGRRRGVPAKHHRTKRYQPELCKISLFRLFLCTCDRLGFHVELGSTYFETKQAMSQYQAVKEMLMGHGAPFAGWVRGGQQWQSFDAMGGVKSRIDFQSASSYHRRLD